MKSLISEGRDSAYYAYTPGVPNQGVGSSEPNKMLNKHLKVTDTDKEKRNFPGYSKNKYYSLGDMQEQSRYEQAGTTDTDSKTDSSSNAKGYAKIYKKSGKVRHGKS